jgi:D-alanyl-D-alanine carboxypeptidase
MRERVAEKLVFRYAGAHMDTKPLAADKAAKHRPQKTSHPVFFILLFACAATGGCAQDKAPARSREEAPRPASPQPQEKAIHPAFSLGPRDLAALTAELPPAQREAIRAQPRRFLDLMAEILPEPGGRFQDPDGLLALVDKKHPLPEGWEPSDLVNLRDYPPLRLSRDNLQLRAILMRDLLAMDQAAKSDGVSLLLSSTYRSAAYQKTVYERNVRELGQAAANRESSRPRHSQHQLGTAIDFGSISDDFTGTKMQLWLQANAWKYGFSLSFPEGHEEMTGYRHESWHFRYIGPRAAEMCRGFFGDIQQLMLEFLSRRGDDFAARVVPSAKKQEEPNH